MCGIGVYISRNSLQREELQKQLQIINECQKHRGPDNSDIYCEPNIGLCHTRLSIIDLSNKANQPFISQDHSFIIVYNGEIYNFLEIRNELEQLGYAFKTDSDTEVILNAYIEWGTNSFIKFNGMFAFAIYDKIANRLIVARDRIGIKVVHYYIDKCKIIFASEIKAILRLLTNIRYRHQAINDVLTHGHIEGQLTAFEDIYTLLPGKYCEINLSAFELSIETYFELLEAIDPKIYIQNKDILIFSHINELDKLITESVKKHLISDAPVGSLCSGGIDSSLITAIAKRINPEIKIYHAGVEGAGGEEYYANVVANHLEIDINYIYMTKRKYLESLVDVVYYSDMPIYHPNDIPLYHICKLANSHGVKVLLCGEGADELFGGYSWQKNFIDALYFKSIFDGILNKNKYIRFIKNTLRNKLFDHIDYSDERIEDYIYIAGMILPYGYKSNFRSIKCQSLILNKGESLIRWNRILDSWKFLDDIIEIGGNSILVDNMLGHLSTILYRTDRMGMMASIENRVPFLENDVINFALNLPLEYKIHKNTSKKVLKLVAERYLPKEIVYRKKAGFPVPWGKYIKYNEDLFNNGFISKNFCIPSELIQRVVNNDDLLLFRLLSLEIWGRMYIYNESKQSIKRIICEALCQDL